MLKNRAKKLIYPQKTPSNAPYVDIFVDNFTTYPQQLIACVNNFFTPLISYEL